MTEKPIPVARLSGGPEGEGRDRKVPSASRKWMGRPGLRRGVLFVSVVLSSAGILAAFGMVARGDLSPRQLGEFFVVDWVLWSAGAFAFKPPLRWVYLLVPVAIPLAGPIFFAVGLFIFGTTRRKNYLVDDPIFASHFLPPEKSPRLLDTSFEEILEQDRKIVSAGDILRWGDISLKQAVIDRLATEGASPRAIRVLKGAWNDPDEEVRLFATTVLTRLEKVFQEKIKFLERDPHPERPQAEIGKAYFDYAVSNLVGPTLARVLLRSGLAAYKRALTSNEPLLVDELCIVGGQAISMGENEVRSLAMDRLINMGGKKNLKILEWMTLYESGRITALRQDVREHHALFEGESVPPYLEFWFSEVEKEGEKNAG